MTSTIASARRRLIRRFAAGLFLLGVLCLAACPAQQPAERTPGAAAPPTEARGAKLVVWADPVLVKALEGLGGAYRQASGGGSYLVEPVERAALRAWAESGESAGRPAPDVLLFGGKEDYLLLLSKQRIAEATARTFAGDRLLVLKPLKTTYYAPTVSISRSPGSPSWRSAIRMQRWSGC
jgi:hypothetical protein